MWPTFVRCCESTRRKPRSSTVEPRRLGADLRPVGPAADRDQDAVERLGVVAERDLQPVLLGLHGRHGRAEVDRLVARGDALLQGFYEIRVAARDELVEQLDDRHLGAERSYTVAISRPMMPPPITSSRSGTSARSSAPGRVHHTLVVGQERQPRGARARRDDAVLEGDRRVRPVVAVHGDHVRPRELAVAAHDVHLAPLGEPVEAAGRACRRPTPSSRGSCRCRATARRTPTPDSASSSASASTRATCSSALDGMQPTFRQTPPSLSPRSISATSSPRSAARNAAV